MNIQRQLNLLTEYVEEHIEETLSPEILKTFLHMDVYAAGKVFAVFTRQSFMEYVRKRRLSLAGYDLHSTDLRVVDVAMKYGYDNATSFARAFYKFHGVKPSEVGENVKLRDFPRMVFDEDQEEIQALDYEVVQLPGLMLYGVGVEVDNDSIGRIAPDFFAETMEKYGGKYGPVEYGMVVYDVERMGCQSYYCLWNKEIAGLEEMKVPESRWLRFALDSNNAKDIQAISQRFYREFLPSCKYTLRKLPELEYYHDNVCDFLVAIK